MFSLVYSLDTEVNPPLMGQPIASHKERSKQIVAKDFSPPDIYIS
jgi:hypothetical protein